MSRLIGSEEARGAWKEFEKIVYPAFFERIMLCGSLRREQPWVHDVDAVGIPKVVVEQVQQDLLTMGEYRSVPFFRWVMDNADRQAPEWTKPTQKWAPKNKVREDDTSRSYVRFFFRGVQFDVYMAWDSSLFWPQVVVRTGPARPTGGYSPQDPGAMQNPALAKRAYRYGLRLAMGGKGLVRHSTKTRVGYESEQEFFAELRLPWCPPELRDHPEWIGLILSVREGEGIWLPPMTL